MRDLNEESLRTLLLSWVAGRQVSDGYVSDGATANRRVEWTPGTALTGGLPLTVNVRLSVPPSPPPANAFVFLISSTTGEVANSLACLWRSSGSLRLTQQGATLNTDQRYLDSTSFPALYAGKEVLMSFVFESGNTTTAPKILANGADITALFTLGTLGAAPNWLPPALAVDKVFSGLIWPTGRAPMAEIGLGSWTLAEHQEWVQTGRKPTWWELGTGSAVNKITGNSESFAGANGWTPIGGATLVTDSANSELDVTATSGQGANLPNAVGAYTGGLTVGKRYRFAATLRNIAFTGGSTLRIVEGVSNVVLLSGITADGTYSVEYTCTNATSPAGVYFVVNGGNGGTFSIYQPRHHELGPVFDPGLQDGTYQSARDMKANGIDGIHTAGMSVVVDGKRRPQIRVKNVNVGTAAYLVQAADVLLPGWDIDCIQITNNGASSAVDVKVQISDGSNHTDIMTAITIAAGATAIVYPTVGGLDTRRRIRVVATSGADNLTFNFSERKRS